MMMSGMKSRGIDGTLLLVQHLEKVFMARGKLDDVPTVMSVPLICVQQKQQEKVENQIPMTGTT